MSVPPARRVGTLEKPTPVAVVPPTRYGFEVTAPRPNTVAERALRASVLPLADRIERVASMLDRWETEDVGDEPDWDVDDLEPLALRPPSRS